MKIPISWPTINLAINTIKAHGIFLSEMIWQVRSKSEGEFEEILAEWEEELRCCRKAVQELEMLYNLLTVYG